MIASRIRKMVSFDPARRCLVHDRINDVWVTWSSVDPLHFNKYADKSEKGLIGWRSLLMDAWMDQPSPQSAFDQEDHATPRQRT
jgi:hypothetical protein